MDRERRDRDSVHTEVRVRPIDVEVILHVPQRGEVVSVRGTIENSTIRVFPLATHVDVTIQSIRVQTEDIPVGHVSLGLERDTTEGHVGTLGSRGPAVRTHQLLGRVPAVSLQEGEIRPANRMLAPQLTDGPLPLHFRSIERPLHRVKGEGSDRREHERTKHRIGRPVDPVESLHERPVIHETRNTHDRVVPVGVGHHGSRGGSRSNEQVIVCEVRGVGSQSDLVIPSTFLRTRNRHRAVSHHSACADTRDHHPALHEAVGVHRAGKPTRVIEGDARRVRGRVARHTGHNSLAEPAQHLVSIIGDVTNEAVHFRAHRTLERPPIGPRGINDILGDVDATRGLPKRNMNVDEILTARRREGRAFHRAHDSRVTANVQRIDDPSPINRGGIRLAEALQEAGLVLDLRHRVRLVVLLQHGVPTRKCLGHSSFRSLLFRE